MTARFSILSALILLAAGCTAAASPERAAPSPSAPAGDAPGSAPASSVVYVTGSPEFEEVERTRFTEAVPGDAGEEPQRRMQSGELPASTRLEFLWEFCDPRLWLWLGTGDEVDVDTTTCDRDAHFVNAEGLGSSGWVADRPFFIAEGFPATGPDPLGGGFDVSVYVTRNPMDLEGADTAFEFDETVHYTTDRVVRGQSDRCGPGYRQQSEPVECVWYVHDFPDGLPVGRYEIVVVWEAPCRAWVDYGLADACDEPDRVESRFSSAFDTPFGPLEGGHYDVTFERHNHLGLTEDEIIEAELSVDADRYRARTTTLESLVEAFNDGRLDDYRAALAPDAAGPAGFDLTDAEAVAALMAASALWSQSYCRPSPESEGVISCGVHVNDQFHPPRRTVQGRLIYSFDDDGRVAAIEAHQSGHSAEPSIIDAVEARRAYGSAFREWLVETHPRVAAPMQSRWLANGMPHADDMSVALRYVDEFESAADNVERDAA